MGVLACALVRPRGWSEAVVAIPAAAVLLGAGAISLDQARSDAERLGPVIWFLAAVLVLAQLCDDEGLFRACGAWMARTAAGRPRRLLAVVFVLASVVTAVLSLDAAVVLLTPVVFATAARLGARPRPHVYACTHLANTASVLLPVSNLTNLLAFAVSGLSFTRFAALMALSWLVAIGAEYAVFRRFFASDLDAGAEPRPAAEPPDLPVFTVAVVACTLAGFGVTSAAGVNPAWAATAGAAVLAARALAQRRTTPAAIVRAANLPFLLFVLALGIVVAAVTNNGLAGALGHLVPTGITLPSLLGTAAIAAVLANVINNLPAALVLLPLAAPGRRPCPRGAARREYRPQPHLRRFPGHTAVAPHRAPARHRRRPWRIHPARAADRASRPDPGCTSTVGVAARHRRLISVIVVVWVAEGTWPACVDAVRAHAPEGADIVLLHVTGRDTAAAAHGAYAGLFGRGHPERDPGTRLQDLAAESVRQLQQAAAKRLGRPSTWQERTGRIEREVVAVAEGADLLILARDGDRAHLAPRSLSPASRFVVDHAPCLSCWSGPRPLPASPPSRPPLPGHRSNHR